jgi:oxygen-dependent protoporphyrinogen oxidase
MPDNRIAIIGGGISGLAAAYELAVHYPEVPFVLYEASARLGGIVETVHEQGFTIECGPDAWVTEKPWVRELVEELGLAEEIIPSNDFQRLTYIAQGNTLLPMPEHMRMMVPTKWESLVHSPLLSWQAKHAYLREPKRAEELKHSALLQQGKDADESVATFVARHFGEEATRTFAGPLLAGVFGGDIDKLSVRAVLAPFVKMEAESGSLITAVQTRTTARSSARPSIFTSLKTGLGTLIQRIVAAIPASSIKLNTPVASIRQRGTSWFVTASTGETSEFDSVFLATPALHTRSLLTSLDHASAHEIASLLPTEASSAVCVALAFLPQKAARLRIKRGFGFLVPGESNKRAVDESPNLLAATFVDQKFAHRAPAGAVLLRGFFGGQAAEQLRRSDDHAVSTETRRQLSRYLGPLPEPDVSVVRHWPASLPQYFVGHATRVERAERLLHALPGLRLLGNSYHGVGLPDLVRDARAAIRTSVSVRVVEALS